MKYPLHVIIRKKISVLFNGFLSLFRFQKETKQYVDSNEIKNILIIRPNYRIGNLIFLTPLINELNKQLPDAKIDIIVGMKLAGEILEPMPNVDQVIDIPRKLLMHPIELYDYIKKARSKKYDIALNISGKSTSAQIVTLLTKAKYKASFDNDKLWVKFTHIQKQLRIYTHMGLRSLEFLSFFNIPLPKKTPTLDIKLTKSEIQKAQEDLKQLTIKHPNKKIIAMFRNARFDKKIADEWWSEWVKELLKDKDVVIIDILSPDIPEKLNDDLLSYSNKNLRILGAFFKACDLYVSADTGPMHLAVASGAKVLALFNKTNIDLYGTLGDKNKTIDIENLTLNEVVAITKSCLNNK